MQEDILQDTLTRFWRRVQKTDTCWLWTGSIVPRGYGTFATKKFNGRDKTYAHIFSYTIHKGAVPPGLLVLHTCDTPGCVNPDHLWLGTAKDNSDDMMRKGRGGHGILRSEDVHTRKLSREQVEEIRYLHSQGHSLHSLARLFNVHNSNIWFIVHHWTWKSQ